MGTIKVSIGFIQFLQRDIKVAPLSLRVDARWIETMIIGIPLIIMISGMFYKENVSNPWRHPSRVLLEEQRPREEVGEVSAYTTSSPSAVCSRSL